MSLANALSSGTYAKKSNIFSHASPKSSSGELSGCHIDAGAVIRQLIDLNSGDVIMKTALTDLWLQMRFIFPYCLRRYFAPVVGAYMGIRTAWRALVTHGVSLQRIGRLIVSPITGAYRYISDESARYHSDLKQFYLSRAGRTQERIQSTL